MQSGHTFITKCLQLWVSRRSIIVFFIYLSLKINSVQPKTLLYTYMYRSLWDLLNVTAPVSKVCSCDNSNHLDINSPLKPLVASCVCVFVYGWSSIAGFEHVCLQHSSPIRNVFSSITISVLPQHKAHTMLLIDMFVCSIIRTWRWVAKTFTSLVMNVHACNGKPYSEVSSRDYLCACDKWVHPVFWSWFQYKV